MRKKFSIKSVSFRSSVQLKSFQHAHVEATAEVNGDEKQARLVLDELKLFVAKELLRAKVGENPSALPRPGRFEV